ncbi:hypothetical protein P7K49_034025, partial [Saguinus oedipus]
MASTDIRSVGRLRGQRASAETESGCYVNFCLLELAGAGSFEPGKAGISWVPLRKQSQCHTAKEARQPQVERHFLRDQPSAGSEQRHYFQAP